ncbi:hypothetical protein A3A76_02070 [Candidatus Woesebacteria bacterium RIFCSPLOWO2_01_FULL_39_23]|uniref:Uncharacterized protein n=1 Tax=Candidatus Woesebacteria bacterium RIFCSPHIGHO2_01_FULL_40_22 TaxID=1802499 RepID=A0A1F7YI50_9BACT|nr:MAG: hypothetical protein A2141_03215 [Candidatus Woesebacteria bacterium RBG_16_40_11]OGM26185.1 MAG: hypothetical protein A2628_02500 [Candidatus Woesebacteria bacterium RIFCSPHIGHO2_01_FULL_40_22]OGM37972.1 MAG: hypothetical protein A3E41_03580 [Candidatus Woesebacteria bacterium RIFCSPHIGHO2_12_FULL_38_9]OGM62344.1 MAG: hypothetical protein A3A76_02070 [Candidatus Woesebacteria bacterium RIFCSPLOWO2_01_FULL_39_23]
MEYYLGTNNPPKVVPQTPNEVLQESKSPSLVGQETPTPDEPNTQTKPKRNFPLYLKVSIVLMVVLLIISGAYFITIKRNKPTTNNSNDTTNKNQPTTTQAFQLNIAHDYTIEVKQNPGCKSKDSSTFCLADIFLKDEEGGNSEFFMTLDNVQNDTREPKVVNGKLFLIKRIVDESSLNPTGYYLQNAIWTDEVWVYDMYRTGTKLFSAKGATFSVSPDGSLVAVEPLGILENPYKIRVITVDDGQQSSDFSINSETCIPNPTIRRDIGWLRLLRWDKGSKILWGDFEGEYAIVGCFWNVNITNGEISYYSVPGILGAMVALNTAKMVAVYDDFPPFVDEDSYNEWVKIHPTYSLYIYDIQTTKSTKIDIFPTSYKGALLGARWISDNTLNYSSPEGPKTYTIP